MPLSEYSFTTTNKLAAQPSVHATPTKPHHPLFGAYITSELSFSDPMEQAMLAHDLLASIRRRHTQLVRYLQAFNTFKANPLGGAMCAEIEEKIHQMALLIRTQQQQLKSIVQFEEEEKEECEVPPASNWLAMIRVTVLKEVVEFSGNELERIERMPLLLKYPAGMKMPRFGPMASIY
ncbi:hypothetical protein LPJ77_004412 [Coemansia sp. RSA 2523]|nr:hypothetical protein LPJ77_004412 [Coemansia sp. RSA 2523]KAJ2417063.1 hypothetical protein GGF47_005344 [Coemansia sp. RSA 2524]